MKVNHLLKFISDLNPQNTPARLALYNFLKHSLYYEENVTPELLNRFFDHALEYPHWQTNKLQLGKEVGSLFDNYAKFYNQSFELSEVVFPQNRQIIELEHIHDWMGAVQAFGKSITLDKDKFKVILAEGLKKVLLIVQHEDLSVTVYAFDRKFTLRKGILEPLRADLKLHYDANLELKENLINTLEISPYLIGQFVLTNEKASGVVIRGYVFQKMAEFNQATLSDQNKLFLGVKRLEHYFIEKDTDPFYLDLIQDLKKLPQLLVTGDSHIERYALKTLDQAELFANDVFVGDKQLSALVKDLKIALSQASSFNSSSKDVEEWQAVSPFKQSGLTS